MIKYGRKRTETEVTLEAIWASEYTFYQTGSRFLGTAKGRSDHDFFALECDEILTLLKLLEFVELKPNQTKYGLDPGVKSVWRKAKVDIQLVEDPELRSKMQNVIKDSGLGKLFIDSSMPKKKVDCIVWRAAWQLAKLKPSQ